MLVYQRVYICFLVNLQLSTAPRCCSSARLALPSTCERLRLGDSAMPVAKSEAKRGRNHGAVYIILYYNIIITTIIFIIYHYCYIVIIITQPLITINHQSLATITGWCFEPLWKTWVRQLGWWNSQYMESHKSHVPNHHPVYVIIYVI